MKKFIVFIILSLLVLLYWYWQGVQAQILSEYIISRYGLKYDDFTYGRPYQRTNAYGFEFIGNTLIIPGAHPVIYKVYENGTIEKLLGNYEYGWFIAGNSITARVNNGITDIAYSNDYNTIFFANGFYHFIYAYDMTNNSVYSFSGRFNTSGNVRGIGENARYNQCRYIDLKGNTLYVSDMNNHIIVGVYIPTRESYVIAGIPGSAGYVDGFGLTTTVKINSPRGLVVDSSGNTIFFVDGNNKVRGINLSDNYCYTIASVNNNSHGLAYNETANIIYVISPDSRSVQKVQLPAGTVSTLIGGTFGDNYTNDPVPFNSVKLKNPYGLLYKNGYLWIGDTDNNIIKKADLTNSTVARFMGISAYWNEADAILNSKVPIFSAGVDVWNNTIIVSIGSTIRKIYPNGIIKPVAGWLDEWGSVDGVYGSSRLGGAIGGVVLGDYYYFYDLGTIKRLNILNDTVETVAGVFNQFGCVDGLTTTVRFQSQIRSLQTDGTYIYIVDRLCHCIRKLDPITKEVITVVGQLNNAGDVDGVGLTTVVKLNSPQAMSFDPGNTLHAYLYQSAGQRKFIDFVGNSVGTYGGTNCGNCSDIWMLQSWRHPDVTGNSLWTIYNSPADAVVKYYKDSSGQLFTFINAAKPANLGWVGEIDGNTYTATSSYWIYNFKWIDKFKSFISDLGSAIRKIQIENVIEGTPTITMTPSNIITPTFTMTLTNTLTLTFTMTSTNTLTPTNTPCVNLNSIDSYFIASDTNPSFNSIGLGYNPTVVGNITWTFNPTPPNNGTYAITGFSPNSYIKFSNELCSALSNALSGGIHFYWYITQAASNQSPIQWNSSTLGGNMGLGLSPSRQLWLTYVSGIGTSLTAVSEVPLNQWNEFLLEWDKSGNLYFYLNGVLKYRGYFVIGSKRMGTITNLILGGMWYNGSTIGNPASGYICQLHFLKDGAPISPPLIDNCQSTLIPTITPYKTYKLTPTPVASFPTVCGTPFPKVWTPVPSPILTPNATENIVLLTEPCLTYHPVDKKYHLLVSEENNPLQKYRIVLYTTNQLDPITGGNWTRQGVIVGDGVAGISKAVSCGEVYMGNGKTRIYFKNGATGNIDRADSYDNGYTYSLTATAISLSSMAPYSLYVGQYVSYYNPGIVKVGNNEWIALVELQVSSNFGPCSMYPNYYSWIFRSTDNGDTFYPYSPVSLQEIMFNLNMCNIWSHNRNLQKIGDFYHEWLGIGWSGPIHHTRSYDLFNWQFDNDYSISLAPPYSNWAPGGWNQIGDSGGVVECNNRSYIAFAVQMQDGSKGVIGLASYNGSLLSYEYCGIDVTPTFTPTFTPTITPTIIKQTSDEINRLFWWIR